MTRGSWGRIGIALAAAVSVLGVAPAGAQDSLSAGGSTFVVGLGAGVNSQTDLQADVRGSLVVTFHGDQRAGCASRGLCHYSGITVVRPGTGGDVLVLKFRDHQRVSYQALPTIGGYDSGETLSRVDRSAGTQQAGACTDVVQGSALGTSPTARRGAFTLSLLRRDGNTLSTRCAGPLDGDVANVSPTAIVPVRRLLRGGIRIDFSGTRTFASNGFAGTVRSTIVLQLHRPQRQTGAGGSPAGPKTKRMRIVYQTLAVRRGGGQLDLAVRGVTDPTQCQLFDSCGAKGNVLGRVVVRSPYADLAAAGPATRPRRDFLAALGMSTNGNPRGIFVAGSIGWAGGTFVANLNQGGNCTDTGPIGGGAVVFTVRNRLLSARYTPGGAFRTRCPGPLLDQAGTFASGSVRLGRPTSRTFTLDLRGTRRLGDEAYSVTSRSHLSFLLHRGRLRQQIVPQLAGFDSSP